jgi:hypothetical protein
MKLYFIIGAVALAFATGIGQDLTGVVIKVLRMVEDIPVIL